MGKFITIKVKQAVKGDLTFNVLKKQYQELAEQYVSVGILQPDRPHPDAEGATVGEIALWQEFGTRPKNKPPTPSRSFLRTPVDKAQGQLFALKQKLLQAITDGKMGVGQGLGIIGADVVRRMQTAIKRRIDPPLAPMTLEQRRKKGITSTVPLYATHVLYNSIHFALRSKRGDR